MYSSEVLGSQSPRLPKSHLMPRGRHHEVTPSMGFFRSESAGSWGSCMEKCLMERKIYTPQLATSQQ